MTLELRPVTYCIYVLGGLLCCVTSCKPTAKLVADEKKTEQTEAVAQVKAKEGYSEAIPKTGISFDMIEIQEGKFMMGSPDTEVDRKPNEGVQREVTVDGFFMAKYELTWNVFELFFKQNKELFVKLENEKVIKNRRHNTAESAL